MIPPDRNDKVAYEWVYSPSFGFNLLTTILILGAKFGSRHAKTFQSNNQSVLTLWSVFESCPLRVTSTLSS